MVFFRVREEKLGYFGWMRYWGIVFEILSSTFIFMVYKFSIRKSFEICLFFIRFKELISVNIYI